MENKRSIELSNLNESIRQDGWKISRRHVPGDAAAVKRVYVESGAWSIEVLPSKGLSIGQAIYKGQKLFWDAPTGLIDPADFNPLSADVRINGSPAAGFSFLKTFASGLELYGLQNWGMPFRDKDGKILPLHGETSNIPIESLDIESRTGNITLMAKFIYRSMDGDSTLLWYQRGEAMFRVDRRVEISEDKGEICLTDSITNVSDRVLRPDFGYHVTLRPEKGSRLLFPSKQIECRGKGELPGDIETWHEAVDESLRTETGIIHKKLQTPDTDKGRLCRVLQKLTGAKGILLSFTPLPYSQSWFCNGGAYSKEFTLDDGTPLFKKSWNGQGIEIGSSALDHDENTDPSIAATSSLSPGESLETVIIIEPIEGPQLIEIEREITDYNKSRMK